MPNQKPVENSSRKAIKYRGVKCLNCGHPLDLSDVYCSYCSQLNSIKQLSLKDFIREFASSVISYDSRLRYTVYDLLFRPGRITKNYVEGQRLKYANPFRFFLSVSIIYFLLQSIVTSFSSASDTFLNLNNSSNNDTAIKNSDRKNDIVYFSEENEKDSVYLTEENFIINKDTVYKKEKEEKELIYYTEAELDKMTWSNRIGERFSLYYNFYDKHKINDARVALDSLKHNNTAYNRWVYNKNSSFERIKNNPFQFMSFMMGKIPFFLFFFAPFFALFFWLIYSKKEYNYIEHMVFIFHIFSFLFLAMLICFIPDTILNDSIFAGIVFVFNGPFYFYKALRNFYKQSRLITLIKFVFLNIVFWVSSTIAALLFFAISAAMY